MGITIDGKEIAKAIKEEIKYFVHETKKEKGLIPTVVSILVGEDAGSQYYQNNQAKIAESLDISFIKKQFNEDISQHELIEYILECNKDESIQGIMMLVPLPKHIDEKEVTNLIAPEKDLDCLTDVCMGKLYKSDKIFYPCTPNSVVTILEKMNIPLEGKEVVVIGRSNIVGKPLAQMLLDKNATITICHSKTVNLKEVTKRADILISAIGRPKYINQEYIKQGAVVIDVGTSSLNGKITGDIDFDDVKDKASYITPVPGGVGALTTTLLFKNLCEAIKKCF